MRDLAALTADDFAGLEGQPFRVAAGEATVDLVLATVRTLGRSGGREAFSLLFHGPPGHPLGQGLHALANDTLGELELFLVPVAGSDPGGLLYEAVFT